MDFISRAAAPSHLPEEIKKSLNIQPHDILYHGLSQYRKNCLFRN